MQSNKKNKHISLQMNKANCHHQRTKHSTLQRSHTTNETFQCFIVDKGIIEWGLLQMLNKYIYSN